MRIASSRHLPPFHWIVAFPSICQFSVLSWILRVISLKFLSDSDVMKLAAHLPGIWHCHYLAGKAQEVRGLCPNPHPPPTTVPHSILSLRLSTDTLPTADPVPQPVPAPIQALFCVASIHSSRNEAPLLEWGVCCLPFKARLAYLIFQGAFPDCPCSLLSATLWF